MANALTTGMEPAAPAPQTQSTPAPGQGSRPQPAPTHAHAVAALRHFSAVIDELEGLLHNPELGKSDVKSAIIDGTTRLVASRMLTPAEAVMQLSSVPADPQLQRKWVQQHFTNTIMAQNAVLDHHRAAFPGTGNVAQEMQAGSAPDDHQEAMQGLRSQYRG